jgi:hypothetical protein
MSMEPYYKAVAANGVAGHGRSKETALYNLKKELKHAYNALAQKHVNRFTEQLAVTYSEITQKEFDEVKPVTTVAQAGYLINIDERQRLALIDTLSEADPVTGEHPLAYWVAMLRGMPEVEKDSPGVTHGFCL